VPVLVSFPDAKRPSVRNRAFDAAGWTAEEQATVERCVRAGVVAWRDVCMF
jgi:hypothetical protein